MNRPPHHVLVAGDSEYSTLLVACLLASGDAGTRVTWISGPEHIPTVTASGISLPTTAPDAWSGAVVGNRGLPPSVVLDIGGGFSASIRKGREDGRLFIAPQRCRSFVQREGRVVALLDDATSLICDTAIIASAPRQVADDALRDCFVNPWTAAEPPDPDAPVLLVGSGLAMTERVQFLREAGHRGLIVVVSRYGLLPQLEGEKRPLRLDRADLPLGSNMRYALRWLKRAVQTHERNGGGWRDILDAIGPHMGEWWEHLPASSQRQFIRHFHRFWDVHRHRMSASTAARIEAERRSGLLRLVRGKVRILGHGPGGVETEITGTRHLQAERHRFAQASDCRGLSFSPGVGSVSFVLEKLDGSTSPDPWHGQQERARFFLLGRPGNKGSAEIVTIPDVRELADEVVRRFDVPV